MPRCSASSCRNMGSHTFPKDPKIRRLWERATNKENFKATKHSRLCAGHFKESDYVDVCLSTGMTPFHRYLKKTAVPSIFPCPSERKAKNKDPMKKINVFGSVASPNNEVKLEEKEDSSTESNTSLGFRSMRLKNRKAYLANRKCSVPHCNMRPMTGISLHPCPNNAAVRNEWAEALRVSYHYVKNMVACSLHFTKLDFMSSKNEERVLKHNAVPSKNLPHRKKVVPKHKPLKKEASSKSCEGPKTMAEAVEGATEVVSGQEIRECRACLQKLDDKKSCCDVFQAWAPPWEGMEATIAEDLAKLANVEITETDRHSKILCAPCYQKLLDAAIFASYVRRCDLILRMRFTDDIDMARVWPKPIQVDKNINGSVFNTTMDIEIKQEVVSDEEYPANGPDNVYVDNELANLDIKIEPEEFVEPPPMNITINGTISLDPLNSENKDLKNASDLYQDTQYLETTVKQEPTSEGEQECEQAPDLPLECMLCTKSFNSVTGLKAHVIAQHSYKTVKRKCDGSASPEKKRREKHQCGICRRNFLTSTDLMVHETCHNKHACYSCHDQFDTFELLTKHRKRCKASAANAVQRLKTLDDVKRPLPEEKTEYLELEIQKLESEDVTNTETEDVEMKELDPDHREETTQQNPIESVQEASDVTNVQSDLKTVSDNNNSELSDVKTMGEINEESDSNMKLHLEIVSTKSEAESSLRDADMQMETLQNDDCL
uniref:THAP-type domain-containing protein n=1 Tax=Heliothis virescens TaxID=7102 RepID=A0A2A4JUJ7_HELVI